MQTTGDIYKTVTIANGASLSDAIKTDGYAVVAVITPSGWTTAIISFQASHDNGTTYNVVWDGTAATPAEFSAGSVPASRYVAIPAGLLLGATHIKVQSGTSAATTNQAGGDIVTVVIRGLA